jgi:hypothetical protein
MPIANSPTGSSLAPSVLRYWTRLCSKPSPSIARRSAHRNDAWSVPLAYGARSNPYADVDEPSYNEKASHFWMPKVRCTGGDINFDPVPGANPVAEDMT